jgi:predicted RNase H-like HicB family nuclease
MQLLVEYRLQGDGTWLAQIPQLPSVLVFGHTPHEALGRIRSQALRYLVRTGARGLPATGEEVLFEAVELSPVNFVDTDPEGGFDAALDAALHAALDDLPGLAE